MANSKKAGATPSLRELDKEVRQQLDELLGEVIQESIGPVKADCAEAKGRVDSIEKEVLRVNGKITSSGERIDTLKSRVDNVKQEIEAAQKEVAQMDVKIADSVTHAKSELENRVGEIFTTLSEKHHALEASVQLIGDGLNAKLEVSRDTQFRAVRGHPDSRTFPALMSPCG
jgi:chromosome segregation ATPase